MFLLLSLVFSLVRRAAECESGERGRIPIAAPVVVYYTAPRFVVVGVKIGNWNDYMAWKEEGGGKSAARCL